MFGLLLLIIVVVVVFFGIGSYNKLISLKNQVQNAWKQIDVQLKRRHDLIPNLINTVKGAMGFERETLEAVVAARNTAIAASTSGNIPATAAAETQLTGALGRLLAVVEAYPDLKATATSRSCRKSSPLPKTRLDSHGSSTTTPRLSTTRHSRHFRRCCSREWQAPLRFRCGRSPKRSSARCRRSISPWARRGNHCRARLANEPSSHRPMPKCDR